MVESYPLSWPDSWPRQNNRISNNAFRGTLGKYREDLYDALDHLSTTRVIVSSNMRVRGDGKLYATDSAPADPAVAVYFEHDKKSMCFACDRFATVAQNIRAITLTIEAIRGIQRWGASDMMERAFRGFIQIAENPWRQILEFNNNEEVSEAAIDSHFRRLATINHPDKGGDPGKFSDLTRAREAAKATLGLSKGGLASGNV